MEDKKLTFLVDKSQIKLLPSTIFDFDNFEIVDGKIYNQTAVANKILSYLAAHKLQNLPAHILFADDFIEQKICDDSEMSDLGDSPKVRLKLGDNKYLTAKVKPEILFQYQMLFFIMGIYLEKASGYAFECVSKLPPGVLKGIKSIKDLDQIVSDLIQVFK